MTVLLQDNLCMRTLLGQSVRIGSRENIMDRHHVISAFVLRPRRHPRRPCAAGHCRARGHLGGCFTGVNGRLLGSDRYWRAETVSGVPWPGQPHGDPGSGRLWAGRLHPPGARTMVLPGVAAFTRVCAYDRPGTIGEVNPDLDPHGPPFFPSRSDPVPQPRTTRDKVADLHALLRAADIRGPYVAHSAGGLVVRLFASMYPDEVVGMVLLDSTHEDVWLRFKEALTPAQWAEFEALTVTNQKLLDAYPEAERWYTAPLAEDATTGQVRESRANAPLRPMPLVVLAHGIPFAAPSPGWPSEKMEGIMTALQEDLAKLVPNAHYAITTKSGHNIHQDQPELVIAAIREVVEAVRNPSTWTTPVPCNSGPPKTAFLRFPSVHSADLEGRLRVELTHSPSRWQRPPPRTFGLRILNGEGREVLSRPIADRRLKAAHMRRRR